ncbi:hypothetical protein lerEdw1_012846 [Lerista edwardsae]|nr:hypothetical protein lerEdw1_012846 [Lerista edwardsae]
MCLGEGKKKMDNSATMLDYGLETTPYLYDYDFAPVQNDEARAFAAHFLPPLYSLVYILGLLGNGLVVLILIRYKKLKSMTDIYLLNLAISDLLFIFTLPFWAYSAVHGWVFGAALCKTFSALYDAGFYSGSFFIVLLTIDRYLAIVHAVFALKARTVVYGIITSLITWVVAFLAATPGFIFYKVDFSLHSKCTPDYPEVWKKIVPLMMLILGLVLPGVIMVFCYVRIVRILIKGRNERKQKAIRLIFVIMIVYFIFWVPFNITRLLETYQNYFFSCDYCHSHRLAIAIQVTESIAMMHSCINPVIYAFVGEKFRKYLCTLFRKYMICLRKCSPSFYPAPVERSLSSRSTSERDISTGL